MTDLRDDVSAAPPEPEPEPVAAPIPWRKWAGWIGFAAYLGVLVWFVYRHGLPMDRIGQTAWIVAGILAAGLGRTWHQHLRVFADWLPLLAALVLYDFSRGLADGLGMPIHVGDLLDLERTLFGGHVPTVWLQEQLLDLDRIYWYDSLISIVYFSHFFVPWLLAAIFYFVSRPLWSTYIKRVLLLSYAGLLTYILLPAAPPWYAEHEAHLIDVPVYRLSGRGWWELGLDRAGDWLAQAQEWSNQVAALPSLHAAFAMLVAVALWPVARFWVLRIVIALYPLAMAFSLVYAGEHYVVDVLLGWLYVAVVVLVTRWWAGRANADRMKVGRATQRDDDGPPAEAIPDPVT